MNQNLETIKKEKSDLQSKISALNEDIEAMEKTQKMALENAQRKSEEEIKVAHKSLKKEIGKQTELKSRIEELTD